VPVWGRIGDDRRALLLVVRGAMPTLQHMLDLTKFLPAVDVALVHLPGMHSPFFDENTPAVFASAFDQTLDHLGYERVIVLGISIGGIVALAMRAPSIQRIILVDTPLTTGKLWPIHDTFRETVGDHAQARRWIAQMLGIHIDRVDDLDYRALLAAAPMPLTAMVGGDALGEPRKIARTPSLVSEADRRVYAADPNVDLIVVPDAGHNVGGAALGFFVGTLQTMTQTLRDEA
jgi:pimeloyl-ACP methyl ester carboxylesterase